MATKKMTKKKSDGAKVAIVPLPEWTKVTAAAAGIEVDQDLRIPQASVKRYLPLALLLEARRPADLTPTEQEALDGMIEGRVAAEVVATFKRDATGPDLVVPRIEVVAHGATATGLLAVAQKSRVVSVAKRADEVARKVFGDDGRLARMNPNEVWMEVERVRKVVEGDAVVRRKLTVFVPMAVMNSLFAANRELGAALGYHGEVAEELPVGPKVAREYLRRCIARYVRCIAASANELHPLSVQRMQAALAPLYALRAEYSRKVHKTTAAGLEEDEVDEADFLPDEVEADPPPTPAAPAAPPAPAKGGDIP